MLPFAPKRHSLVCKSLMIWSYRSSMAPGPGWGVSCSSNIFLGIRFEMKTRNLGPSIDGEQKLTCGMTWKLSRQVAGVIRPQMLHEQSELHPVRPKSRISRSGCSKSNRARLFTVWHREMHLFRCNDACILLPKGPDCAFLCADVGAGALSVPCGLQRVQPFPRRAVLCGYGQVLAPGEPRPKV
jgi:hypothetical protein